MPGFEVFGNEERDAINELFDANGGILFAHSFDVARKGIYRVREFEKAFSDKMDVNYSQAVSSGSAAVLVALKAAGIKAGDEVIVPAFTFVATIEAVLMSGAVPIIVDIDESFNICCKSIENAITDKTKAIIPVHMLGAPADMDGVMEIAKKHGLLVIEDNAQGCGGTFKGKKLGTIGDVGAFSFDAGKVMITGEGGMVCTNDKDVYIRARAYHDHGHEYSTTLGRGEEGALLSGFNFRMTELQGTIGLVQLSKLNMILEGQRNNKKRLKDGLLHLPVKFRKILDEGELGDALVFTLENEKQAEAFVAEMKKEGLGTKNVPDALNWHFAGNWRHIFKEHGIYLSNYREQWDITKRLLYSSVALPVMIKMTDEQIENIVDKICKISKVVM